MSTTATPVLTPPIVAPTPSPLAAIHADAVALLTRVRAAGKVAGADAAKVLATLEAQLIGAVQHIEAVAGPIVLSDAQKLEQVVMAELTTQAPVVVSAVVSVLLAMMKAGVPVAAAATATA